MKKITVKKLKEKKGSYMVEAALTLPVLILCICALILIIKIISSCENICFITAEEMLDINLGAYKFNDYVSLCNDMEKRIVKDCAEDFKVTGFKYLYNRGRMTDLIAFEAKAKFTVTNAIGAGGEIEFEEKLLTRGFTGNLADGEALDESEFYSDIPSCEVIVFPKYGMRYHRKGCKYVKQNENTEYKMKMEREDAKLKGYTPCKACGGAANV